MIAGVTTAIEIVLDFTGNGVEAGDVVNITAVLNGSVPGVDGGCLPHPDPIADCFATPVYTFQSIVIENPAFVPLQLEFAHAVDFSFVGQFLEAHVSAADMDPPLTAGYERVTATTEGAAPTVQQTLNQVVAGSNGTSRITVQGTGFSRYAEQMQQIQLTPEPVVGTVESSTATQMVLRLSMPCNEDTLSTLDLSLVDFQLALTQLGIAGSNLAFDGSVLLSEPIQMPEFEYIVETKADFESGRVVVSGQFSCQSDLTTIQVLSSTGIDILPTFIDLSVSQSQLEFNFMSCNGNLNGLDYSLSGSFVQIQINSDKVVNVSDLLQANDPVLEIPTDLIALTAGQTITDPITITGSSLSCEPSTITLIFTTSTGIGLPPTQVNITAATRTSVSFIPSSCGRPIIDTSMAGSQLSIATSQSEAIVFTQTIVADPPTFDTSLVQLTTETTRLVLPSTGFSCSKDFNLVTTPTPRINITYEAIDDNSVAVSFQTCGNSVSGIDSSLIGSVLELEVEINSVARQKTQPILIGSAISGPDLVIESISPLKAGVFESTVIGQGFSCYPEFNNLELFIKENQSLSTVIMKTTSNELKVGLDLDFSLVNAPISAVIQVGNNATRSEITSVGNVTGENPSFGSMGDVEICTNVVQETEIQIQVQGISSQKELLQVKVFGNDIQIPSIQVTDVLRDQVSLKLSNLTKYDKLYPLSVQLTVTTSKLSSEVVEIGKIGDCSSGSENGGQDEINQTSSSDGLSGGSIAAISIGCIALVGFIFEVIYLARKKEKERYDQVDFEQIETPVASRQLTPRESIISI